MKRVIRLLCVMSVIVSSAGQALADDTPGAELLSTGTKASSLGIDIGASIGMSSSGTNFDLHLNYTHHFSGDASGFNLGADLDIIAGEGEQAFLVPAVRAGYDHEVALGVYLAPFASLGPVIGTKGYIGFDARFGLGVKLIMNDLWIVNVQPVGVDLVVGTEGVDVRYSLLFGGGIIF